MDIEYLINEVFVRAPLWDQKDARHHNRFVLDKMWDEVATEMNTSKETVRTRWKSLRDGFRKELKKYPRGLPGEAGATSESNDSTWPYFKSLYFLKDQFTNRPCSGNVSIPPDSLSDEIQLENIDEESNQSAEEPSSAGSVLPVEAERVPMSFSRIQKHVEMKRARKRCYPEDIGIFATSTLLEIQQQILKVIEEERNKVETHDEDVSFFDSLLPPVKKLEPMKKMLLRIKIQELVYNFIYKQES